MSRDTVEILRADWDDEPYSYIFEDVAELFWPGDYGKSNHDAQDKIIEYIEKFGCQRIPHTYCDYETPQGAVMFDSESGMFNVRSADDAGCLYIKTAIDEIKAQLDAHREALS